jgi:hypothetical protein
MPLGFNRNNAFGKNSAVSKTMPVDINVARIKAGNDPR